VSPSPADRFDAFLLDLDGVLYRGGDPVEGAPEAVDALRSRSKAVVFVTNNSWRTPAQVAAKLEGMGIQARPEEVVTSGQATAAQLRRDLGANGATAYVLGGEGVRSALADAGIDSADGEPDRVDVVVVGWDRDLTYDRLRTATVLIGRGAGLVATNADPSYPAPGGELWPGAGAILAAVEAGSGRRATVVGKPQRPLFDLAVDRAGSRAALVVGDRIETDIVGAANAGLDSALVLTGASTPADLLVADALPTMVVADLGELTDERSEPSIVRAETSHQGAVRALLDEMGLSAEPGWDRDAETVVALLDGDVVVTSAADVQAEDAYLRSVAVREGLRGTGLGMLMVATVVRNIRRRGANRLWLVTETAAPFFERLGFAPVERAALPRWIADGSDHCPGSAVAMRRDIAQ
jgi:phosphoglycolate/pyridoxal phosphate phosphatase family enzyme